MKVFFLVSFIGVLGLYIGAIFLNLEGYLGVILSIAAASGCIARAIKDGKK